MKFLIKVCIFGSLNFYFLFTGKLHYEYIKPFFKLHYNISIFYFLFIYGFQKIIKMIFRNILINELIKMVYWLIATIYSGAPLARLKGRVNKKMNKPMQKITVFLKMIYWENTIK